MVNRPLWLEVRYGAVRIVAPRNMSVNEDRGVQLLIGTWVVDGEPGRIPGVEVEHPQPTSARSTSPSCSARSSTHRDVTDLDQIRDRLAAFERRYNAIAEPFDSNFGRDDQRALGPNSRSTTGPKGTKGQMGQSRPMSGAPRPGSSSGQRRSRGGRAAPRVHARLGDPDELPVGGMDGDGGHGVSLVPGSGRR
jgi:hypothetical protein